MDTGQSPQYGFKPQPEPEYIGFIKQLIAGLNDPRTQAMLAPGMGLAKAPQAAWNATRIAPNMASERGNWNPFGWIFRPNSMDPRPELNMNVPLSHMREQISGVPNAKEFVGHVEDVNKLADIMRNGNETIRSMDAATQTAYLSKMREVNPQLSRSVEDAILGQRKLQMENNRAFSVEDKVPPEILRRMFGYKGE